MRPGQSGVLTVGMLVPKEGGHTLLHNTLLVIPPWSSKPPLFVEKSGGRKIAFH